MTTDLSAADALRKALEEIRALPTSTYHYTDSTMRQNPVECYSAYSVRQLVATALAGLAAVPEGETFQQRVAPWMQACFGPEISNDKVERGDRFLEEVFEQLQAGGYDPARIVPLRDYVWSRPAGEPDQEVGGVMVTQAAYCLAHGLDMHAAGDRELARIWTKVETIRAKQAAKPKHSPLPISTPATPDAREGALEEAAEVADAEARMLEARMGGVGIALNIAAAIRALKQPPCAG